MAALQSYESAQKHPCGHVSAGVASVLVAVSKITQAHVALASDLSKPTYAILSEPLTSAMVWCRYLRLSSGHQAEFARYNVKTVSANILRFFGFTRWPSDYTYASKHVNARLTSWVFPEFTRQTM